MYYQTYVRTDATNFVIFSSGYIITRTDEYRESIPEQPLSFIWLKRRELTRKGIELCKKRHEKFPFMKERFNKPIKKYKREPRMTQRFAARNQVIS